MNGKIKEKEETRVDVATVRPFPPFPANNRYVPYDSTNKYGTGFNRANYKNSKINRKKLNG